MEYKFILETISNANRLDEEHVLLTIDKIKESCLTIFKEQKIRMRDSNIQFHFQIQYNS
jgi:hypothetical protein